jgi:predicted outer membrane repeat protein
VDTLLDSPGSDTPGNRSLRWALANATGGDICNTEDMTLEDCVFTGNHAKYGGGALRQQL